MPRDVRSDPLFRPLAIGPVTAPNRFWQVPHCTGMGWQHPAALAAMRGVKAEGGWGVVNSEYCSIHPSSDDTPAPYASLRDDGDVANMGAMADAVHAHGALAGVELWHGWFRSRNVLSRVAPLGPESLPVEVAPWQSQRMDRADIAPLRGWHRAGRGRPACTRRGKATSPATPSSPSPRANRRMRCGRRCGTTGWQRWPGWAMRGRRG